MMKLQLLYLKRSKKPIVQPSENKPVVKPTETKPVKPSNSALNSIIKGPKQGGTTQSGHGDDDEGGDKGNPNGSLYANSFTVMVLVMELELEKEQVGD